MVMHIYCYWQAYHAGIAFTQWSKNGFWATRFPDKREIWHGWPPCQILRKYWGRSVGIHLPKLSKFRIFAINLPLRGHLVPQFLRNYQILYASVGGF